MSKIVCYLTQIARCSVQYRNRQLEPLGITVRQTNLLLEICATPGISQDTLAKRLFLDKSVVARALANLEEQGLVERPVCPNDRRVIRLHPTEKALQMQPQLQAVSAGIRRIIIGKMSSDIAQSSRTEKRIHNSMHQNICIRMP